MRTSIHKAIEQCESLMTSEFVIFEATLQQLKQKSQMEKEWKPFDNYRSTLKGCRVLIKIKIFLVFLSWE